jgi:diguanylate cyclase (GGDEF)-like protein
MFHQRSTWLLQLAVVLACAAAVIAALTGHPTLTVLAVLATLGGYPAGYQVGYLACKAHTDTTILWLRRRLQSTSTDQVTGLPTRVVAETVLTEASDPVVVALIAVDGLRMVNGNFGHQAGDTYLRQVAARLQLAVPIGGLLARLSGSELVLLAPVPESAGDLESYAQMLGDEIGAALAGPVVVHGHHLQPRVLVGMAGGTGELLGRADAALYSAKRDGRTNIRLFDEYMDPAPGTAGIRRAQRLRDIPADAEIGSPWQPPLGPDLIPVLLSTHDLHTIRRALDDADDGLAGRIDVLLQMGRCDRS